MTTWQISEAWICIVVYAVAWTWGGRRERLATGLLLLDQLISMDLTFDWSIEDFYLVAVIKACVLLWIFGWLAIRSDRWWPLLMTAALCLILFTYVLRLGSTGLSHFAAASARLGLAYLIDLILLFSVFERWLAGEPAARRIAWAKAANATAFRRVAGDQNGHGVHPT